MAELKQGEHAQRFSRVQGTLCPGDDRLVTIELSEEAVEWLREATSKPLSGCDPFDEDEEASAVRRGIWNVLNTPDGLRRD